MTTTQRLTRRPRRWPATTPTGAAQRRRGGDAGHIGVFTVLTITTLLLVTGLVLDAGLALSSKTQALDVAQSAARAGAGQLHIGTYRDTGALRLDRTLAAATARNWLTRAGMTGQVTVTATTVTVTARTARATQLLSLIGVRRINVSATATSVAHLGVSTPDRPAGGP